MVAKALCVMAKRDGVVLMAGDDAYLGLAIYSNQCLRHSVTVVQQQQLRTVMRHRGEQERRDEQRAVPIALV